jgi:ribosome-binding protein aMBF1 (putative translation factor)
MHTSQTQYVVAPAPRVKTPEKKEIKMINGQIQYIQSKQQKPKINTNNMDNDEKVDKIELNVSRQIINARTRLGLTQSAFALRANINANVLKSYENGTVVPNSMELQQLSRAAGETFKITKP